jgi:hypothetical protein
MVVELGQEGPPELEQYPRLFPLLEPPPRCSASPRMASQWHRTAATPQTGRKSTALDFVRSAKAPVNSSVTVRASAGRLSQYMKAISTPTREVVKGIFLVARPPWARMGGSMVNRSTAPKAGMAPNSIRLHAHTRPVAARKKGSTPRRARVRLRE